MANRTILDAMIKRADFGMQSEPTTLDLPEKLMLEQITGETPIGRLMRKPDFQRETNHWSPQQVATLIKSFATGELIPALILWKSEAFVFVIDGGHRISALRAWINNDYGAGHVSHAFYDGNIPVDQKKKADATRRLVERTVGRYSDFKSQSEEDGDLPSEKTKIASTIFSRALRVQWIQGSREVAEASFFKINSQGTVLDVVEELLLRNRKKSYAIAARSVVRAGSGHKYWSTFEPAAQNEIEGIAIKVNSAVFQPDINEPIKTLDLPLGGTSSPVDALKILVDIFSIIDGETEPKNALQRMSDDEDGLATISVLKHASKVVNRVTGNAAGSLGLHPAVYFYTEKGKHSRFMFLGIIKAIAKKISDNDKNWFVRFTKQRAKIERTFIDRKALINQGLANINSRQRIDRVSKLLTEVTKHFETNQEVTDEELLGFLGLTGSASRLKIIDAPTAISDETKSEMFL